MLYRVFIRIREGLLIMPNHLRRRLNRRTRLRLENTSRRLFPLIHIRSLSPLTIPVNNAGIMWLALLHAGKSMLIVDILLVKIFFIVKC